MTFLIASKPAPENVAASDCSGAAISSAPPREPGGGKSSAIDLKDSKPALSKPLVPVTMSVMFAGAAGGK